MHTRLAWIAAALVAAEMFSLSALAADLAAPAQTAGETTELRLRTATGETVLPANGVWTAPDGARWHTQLRIAEVAGRPGCIDLHAQVTLEAGQATAAVVSLATQFRHWTPQAYVFAPASVYDGNRFDVVDVPYSPFWPNASYYRVDMPLTITRQPQLERDGRPAEIELDTGNTATPCVGFRRPDGAAMLLLTPQQNELGNYGLTIAEDGPAGTASFVVGTPRARSRVPKIIGFAPGDPPREWKAGQRATLQARRWFFQAPQLCDFFQRFGEARKDFDARAWTNEIPFSVAARLARDKLNAINWDEALGYYRHGVSRVGAKPFDWWQLGWVTGGITTLPMLLDGDPAAQAHARRNLDFLFTGSPVPNGLWRAHHDGTKFNSDDPRPPRPGYQVSVRRLSDGLMYGLQQIMILRGRGQPVPPAWETSVRNLADALVRVFERRGQLGQYLDIRSGDILIGNTTAGAAAPAGLLLAAEQFHEPRYREAAEAIARHLVRTALDRGLTTGGPCDALAAPDSESSFALVQSLVALHEATGKSEWKDAARAAIRLFATWVTSYDYQFPPDSVLGRAGIHATGSVWANVQNKHAAPAICNFSGDALFRHWRATGDEFALDLIRDIAHHLPTYVSRADRPLAKLAPGMMCERVNLSDWEGAEAVGSNIYGSVIWVETALALTAAEIPGVYVRLDTGRVVVFDHVEAQWQTGSGRHLLTLRNPTRFDATVAVLAEDTATAAKPLGPEPLAHARRVPIRAGETAEIPF